MHAYPQYQASLSDNESITNSTVDIELDRFQGDAPGSGSSPSVHSIQPKTTKTDITQGSAPEIAIQVEMLIAMFDRAGHNNSTLKPLQISPNPSARWPNTLLSPVPSPVTLASPSTVRFASKPTEITWRPPRALRPLPRPPPAVVEPITSALVEVPKTHSNLSPTAPVFTPRALASSSRTDSNSLAFPSATQNAFPTWRKRVNKAATSPPMSSPAFSHFHSPSSASEGPSWRKKHDARPLPRTGFLSAQPHASGSQDVEPDGVGGGSDMPGSHPDLPSRRSTSPVMRTADDYFGLPLSSVSREPPYGGGPSAAPSHANIQDSPVDTKYASVELTVARMMSWTDVGAHPEGQICTEGASPIGASNAKVPFTASPQLGSCTSLGGVSQGLSPSRLDNSPIPTQEEEESDTHSPPISPPAGLAGLPGVSPLEGTPVDPFTKVYNRFSTAFSDPFPAFEDPLHALVQSPVEMHEIFMSRTGANIYESDDLKPESVVGQEKITNFGAATFVSPTLRRPLRPIIRVITDKGIVEKPHIEQRPKIDLGPSSISSPRKSTPSSSLSTDSLADALLKSAYATELEVELVTGQVRRALYESVQDGVESGGESLDFLNTPSSLEQSSPLSAGSISGFKSCVSVDDEDPKDDSEVLKSPGGSRAAAARSEFSDWRSNADDGGTAVHDGLPRNFYVAGDYSDSETDVTSMTNPKSDTDSLRGSVGDLDLEDEKAFGESIFAEQPPSAIVPASLDSSPMDTYPTVPLFGLGKSDELVVSQRISSVAVAQDRGSLLHLPDSMTQATVRNVGVQSIVPSQRSPVSKLPLQEASGACSGDLSKSEEPPIQTLTSLSLHCRICERSCCIDPTATMGCGHLFCYACIADAVMDTRRCPVCLTPTLLYCLLKLNLSVVR
ncbi:hypothetical protein HGRIS_012945 [Hohenbuehelia grisea]|uniref:RING-type domain-containing protein n=1 Tax=Hohenbuehelia grisea TaxID=104357 RepID=A0ABR3IU78_9AGAR